MVRSFREKREEEVCIREREEEKEIRLNRFLVGLVYIVQKTRKTTKKRTENEIDKKTRQKDMIKKMGTMRAEKSTKKTQREYTTNEIR